MQKSNLITQSTVLGMGWTKKMIDTLLPEPILKDNPRYRCAAPMRLFEEEAVLAVMETEEFIAAFEKTKKRRESSWKANQTKREKLENLVDERIRAIKVEVLPDDELVSETLEEREDWYRYNAEIRGEYDYRFYGPADTDTLNRWVVNFIRHNLVEYDESLYKMKGKVGIEDEYVRYKFAVLDRIAETYPKYAEECNKQKNRVEEQSFRHIY